MYWDDAWTPMAVLASAMTDIVRLPQLAVLAKILCLLMVVMCGAVPAMVRSVSLYSACSSENVTVVGRMLRTLAKDNKTAPYQLLTTQSEDFSKRIYIYAEKSQRYICFNKNWKPVALLKKQRNERCQFYESFIMGGFLRYSSAVNSKHMLGFNKLGKPKKNQRGRQECFNFIKYNAESSENRYNRHNEVVSGSNGGIAVKSSSNVDRNGPPQRDSVNTRKRMLDPDNYQQHQPHQPHQSQQPQPQQPQLQQQQQQQQQQQHRFKKNSLQADEAPRETMITTTSHHHHRHSNRLKQPHQDIPSPRRRHHQSRTLEASKY